MKKINAKYLTSAVAVSGIMLAAMTGSAFAAENTTVPVYLTVAATPIDVTVGTGLVEDPTTGEVIINPGTEDEYTGTHGANAIYMSAKADSNVASVTNLVVTNNATAAPIYVTNISLSNITSGYTNAAYSDDFTAKAVDSKNFGLAITSKGGTTLEADLKTGYTTVDSIAASGSLTYGLSGKVSATSTAIDQIKVADCIVTVSQTNN